MIFILRKISSLLSVFFKNDLSRIIIKDKKIINYIKKKLEKKKNINLKKTHIYFNDQLYDIIDKGDLKSFLRYSFIQKIFFVHNRFFIFKELNKLKKNNNWKFYKKLLIEDNVGNPVRYFLYPKSSGNKINHVYHLSVLSEYSQINLKKINYVFEFGGGYGCMARIFSKINKNVKYYLFDTEIVNLLQYYYLKHNNLDVGFDHQKKIVLKNKFNKINKSFKNNSLFIANWSLSETPINFRKRIISIMKKYKYVLISFQENFENINNKKYFYKIKSELKKQYKISIILNKYYKGSILRPQNHYFFIAKKL
tara:strand:- start:1006 stop:1932 length:927 start_codon:yes stop_codon:yes gene_type:complete